MTASIRYYGTGLLFSALLVGVAVAQPSWLEVVGIEVAPSTSTPQSDFQHVGIPNLEKSIPLRRSVAKQQVIDRLIDGEMDLFTAAAWFRDLNAEPAECPSLSYRNLRGSSDEEKLCRQVISWASSSKIAHSSESQAQDFIASLENELSARLCAGGPFQLPTLR